MFGKRLCSFWRSVVSGERLVHRDTLTKADVSCAIRAVDGITHHNHLKENIEYQLLNVDYYNYSNSFE